MPDAADRVREELRAIGQRREAHDEQDKRLAKDTAAAVRRAKGVISMSEVAALVGIDRTGLYRTYGAR